jgi:tetratricopeptide (TPR) repeat protein
MKFTLTVTFALMFILSNGCQARQDCQEGINLLPMYGGVKKCTQQIKADEEFLSFCDKTFKSRREAIAHQIKRGWEFFYKGQLDLSMKRFNQVWLLDSTNADAYWGFGNILGKQGKYQESLIYFDKSLMLDSTNSKIWYCTGLSYSQLFFQTKDINILNKAIYSQKIAVSLDPEFAEAYGELAASYSYFMQKDSLRKYLRIADKLNPNVINPEVRQRLKE